jgi:hypothetical protein
MNDDRSQRSGRTRSRINPAEGYELNYWTRQLGCTEQQLLGAISAVGPQVDSVRLYLSRQTDSRRGNLGVA